MCYEGIRREGQSEKSNKVGGEGFVCDLIGCDESLRGDGVGTKFEGIPYDGAGCGTSSIYH